MRRRWWRNQDRRRAGVPARAMKTGLRTHRARRRPSCSWPMRPMWTCRPGRTGAAGARAPLPSRCWPAARWTPARDAFAHADGVAAIPRASALAPSMRAAAYLVYAGDFLQKPEEVVAKAFGESYAGLVAHTRRLVQIQRAAREANVEAQRRAEQTERVRKMLLAFSRDLRVVLLRLASRAADAALVRGQQARMPARAGRGIDAGIRAAGQPAGHLADQVGDRGSGVPLPRARRLPPGGRPAGRKRRVEREQGVEAFRVELGEFLALRPEGRGAGPAQAPLYSIWKKMRGKGWTSRACSTSAPCA